MNIRFDGKTAVVTGGAKGIGREVAMVFAESGADVVIGDILDEAGEQTCEEIRKLGRMATYVHCDVTNVDQCRQLMMAADHLDIMVNVAGITAEKRLMDASQELVQKVMDVNAIGSSNVLRAALKFMIPQRFGRVVMIASIAGRMNSANFPHYAMSKAAVLSLVISAAKSMAQYGITVNGICPGFIRTDMWEQGLDEWSKQQNGRDREEIWDEMVKNRVPLGVAQTPRDIANAVAFLCSEQTKNITGQSLHVDGSIQPLM